MEFRIGFKTKFDLVQNSTDFNCIQLLKEKIKEKARKEKEKETKEDAVRIKLKHIKGIQNQISSYDLLICFNSEFGCIQFSLILLPWDLGRKKQTACRKQRFNNLGQQMIWQLQETWALQVEFSSLHEGAQQYQLGLHQVWLQVIGFGGAYRFTWFGALSQHDWSLPY